MKTMNMSLSRLRTLLCNRRPTPLSCMPTVHPRLYSSTSHAGEGLPWYKQVVEPSWQHKIAAAATVCTTGCGAAAVYLRYSETVPFTGRMHLVTFSPSRAREIAESEFAYFMKEHASKILSPDEPDAIRVHGIADKIIRAVIKEQTSKSGPRRHYWVDVLDWEVIVVRDDDKYARSFPDAGKIVVYTGLLREFETDAEMAVCIAHEVGHILARHSTEMMPIRILNKFPYSLLLVLAYVRRKELEADHIGILLHAAAGYDPRVTLNVWSKLAEKEKEPSTLMKNLRKQHPSRKKRLKFLSQPKLVEKALDLYRQAISTDGQCHN